MKKVYLLLLLCFLSVAGFAQTTAASYCFSASAGTYTPLVGGTDPTPGSTGQGVYQDDGNSPDIAIGFPFVYCGTTYNFFKMSSNVWMTLGVGTTSSPGSQFTNSSANATSAFLMPLWDDMSGSNPTQGQASYATTGVVGSRVLTVQWGSWGYAGTRARTGPCNIQVKLYEGTNHIEFIYGANNFSALTATIGIANSTSDFLNVSGTTPTATSTGSTTFNAGLTTSPAVSGTTYTFVPKPNLNNFTSPTTTLVCAGAPSTVTVNSTTLSPSLLYNTTWTVSYTLSGANTAGTQTATLTMGSTNGTFTVPGALLPNIGNTTITITNISSSAGSCSTVPASNNTATIVVNSTTTPVAPVISSVTSVCNAITVNWGTVANANNYQLEVATENTFASPVFSTTVGNVLTRTVTGLNQNTQYFYRLRALNTCAASQFSPYTTTANITTTTTPTVTAGKNPLCGDGVTTAIGAPAGGTWTSGTPAAAAVTSGGIISGVAAGTSIISYGSGGCYATFTQTVTATQYPPAFTITPSSPTICAGTVQNLTAPAIPGLSQTASASASPNIPIPDNTPSGATSSVTISGIPSNATITEIQVVLNSVTITWNSDLVFNIKAPNGAAMCLVNKKGNQGDNFTNCILSSIGVTALPTVDATPITGTFAADNGVTGAGTGPTSQLSTVTSWNALYTPGTPTTLNGTWTLGAVDIGAIITGTLVQWTMVVKYTVPGGGYVWSGTAGLFNDAGMTVPYTGAAVTSVYASPSATTTYTATGTYPGGACATVNTAVVNVNPRPSITVGTMPSICTGTSTATLPFSSPTGTPNTYSIVWSGPAFGLFAPVTDAPLPPSEITIAVPGGATGGNVYTGTLTVKNAGSCVSVDIPITVTVTTQPTITGTTPNVRCNTGVVNLGATTNAGTISWYADATGGPALTTGTSYSPNISATTTFYVESVNGICATPTRTAVTGTVNRLPSPFTATVTPNPACVNGVITLTGSATGDVGTTYSWAGPQTLHISSATSLNAAITDAALNDAGTYTITATAPTCGSVNALTNALVVNPRPTVSFIAEPGATTCIGVNVTYTTQPGQNDYIWNVAGIPETDYTIVSGSITPGSTTNSITLQWLSPGAHTVTVNYTNPTSTCTGAIAASSSTTTNPRPLVNNVTGGGTYCTSGVHIGLDLSQNLISYQLFRGITPVGSPFIGGGGAIDFGVYTVAGNYSVRATNTTTGCTNDMNGTATVAVSALIPNVYNVTGGGNYCAGGAGVPITMSGSDVTVSYQLYAGINPVGGLVPGTGSAINFGLQTATGLYSVIANPATDCETAMNGNPTIGTNPAPAAIGGTLNTCVGTSTTLTNSGTGTWSSSNTSFATVNASTGTVTGVAPGSPAITFTLASTGCTRTASVTVSPFAAPITGTTTTVCAGGSVTLANASAPAGTWSSSNGFTTINASTGVATGVSAGTSTISYITGPGCFATTGFTVNSLPTIASITPSSVLLCANAQLTLTAGSVFGVGSLTSYNWAGPNSYGSTSTVGNKTLTVPSIAASGIYSVTVTYPGPGCTSLPATSAAVTVKDAPTLTSASNNGPLCAGAQLELTANTPANVTSFSWAGPVAITTGSASASATVNPTTAASAGVYTVTVNNGSGTGCAVNYYTTALVNALPPVVTVTGAGGPFCGSTTLTASNGGFGTIYFQGTTSNGTSTVTPSVLQVVSGVGTNNYYFRALSAGGCWGPQGVANVTISPLPVAYTITGGGSYCSGGNGVVVGLNGSEGSNVSYQLYNGAFPSGAPVAGTGSAISFGLRTDAGNYTVVATYTTSPFCSTTMTGTTTIAVSPVPTPQTVIGGGSFCIGGAGVSVGLNGSGAGVSYQLYRDGLPVGGLVTGTGSGINFGLQSVAGTYSVTANPSSTCALGMTGNVTVSATALPTQFAVSGTGSYCPGSAGLHVGLGSSQTSTNYQLYKDGIATGATVPGTGAPLDFGIQTAGNYTIVAINTSTSCTNTMTGTAAITTSPVPAIFTATGGGSYCSGGTGVLIGLNNSVTGINYTLYNASGAASAPTGGTGSAISFGLQTAAGTYTVIASNATTFCSSVMSGNPVITVGNSPQLHNVVGGGNQCAGGLGFDIGIDGSDLLVSYQLYRDGIAVGGLVAGTGANLDLGLQTAQGVYTVKANPGTTCETDMTGSASINIVSLPVAFVVTGGGTYCAGGSGFNVGLNGSQTNVDYRLYKDGLPIGAVVPGTGSALDFGVQMDGGTYKVMATSNITTCSTFMTDSAVIVFHPVAIMHSLTGGGSYCEGGTGVNISLSGSEVGVTYQLYISNTPVGSLINGTGLSIDFGNQTVAGQYAAVANPASTCATTMTNSVTVTVNPKPTAYTVTGTGGYCAGGAGLHVGLSGSNTGISYQLYNGSIIAGAPLTGTGGALDFGLQTAAGTYSVIASNLTTGCSNTMIGNAVITVNAIPTMYTVTGGGGYCTGGAGVHVGLSGSAIGTNYQLYNGVIPQGIAIAGTGAALDFGLITLGGTYTVKATNPSTLCGANMSGSVVVTMNALPTAYNLSGTGSYCAGGAGVHLNLSNSTSGVNYQLYNETGAIGAPVAGTGSALDLGAQTSAGTYTVVATTTGTGCQNRMNGTATITMNALPIVYSVTGGGAYCAGGTGVLVGLNNSEAGTTYTLRLGGSIVGTVVSTGGAFNFAPQLTAGTYSVVAVNANTCTSNMSGTAVITINAQPTAYTVSGTGAYCAGGNGVQVLLSNSATGVEYQLYNGSTMVGTPLAGTTGSGINFGFQTAAGTYSVLATNTTTGCTRGMTGSATITINALPNVIAVTGGGHYCAGGTGVNVGLGTSQAGISYQLVNQSGLVGSPIIGGAGTPINFGLQTAAGSYSVIATNAFSTCQVTMSGNAVVVIDPLPAAYTVSGGGIYCAGGAGYTITLSGSQLGVNYQLLLDGSAVGGTVAGTGGSLNMGVQMAQGAYTVRATDAATGCTRLMTGSTTISVNAAPTVYAMTGGGAYCSGGTGVHVGLGGSNLGINYQLYNGSTPVASLAGTNNSLDFGFQTAAGTYSVTATNAITGCPANMSGSATVSINPLPAVYVVGGTGSYCAGGAGVDVFLSNSDNTIRYQLYRNGSLSGSPLTGVNGPLSFGMQTAAGAYTVVASDIVTGCTSNMSGTATVTVNPLPAIYTISGGGSYCTGGTGVLVGLNSSANGISYALYNNSGLVTGMNGTGSAISFGLQTTAGTYTVVATNSATNCVATMSGVATVSVNALPTVYPVLGGGTYCSNGTGVNVTLDYSDAGIRYQLYRGSAPVGVALDGVNGTLDFGLQTATGTYSVMATNIATTCTAGMSGSATISTTPAPVIYAVTGGGSYCQGSAGVHIGLSNSEAGTNYELFHNGTSAGIFTGTGTAMDFGLQTAVGTYSVVATSGTCTSNMSGSATVSVNVLPNVYTILGAASSYCAGGTGIDLVLTNSEVGVNYQLINGSANVGFAVPGTGTTLDFGLQTLPGTYIVLATNASTTCSAYMASAASIVVSPLPTIYAVTGGGAYCAGSGGNHIGLSSSNTGITYRLYRGGVQVGSVAGTGSAIDFGLFTTIGSYSVVATNNTTLCTNNMSGVATISVNDVPVAQTVTGGGDYCSGTAGVHVGLSSSVAGINYQLYAAGAPVGFPVAGTGAALDFGAQTTIGAYTVVGINSLTACGAQMTGTVTVNMNALPAVQTLTGGGHYCAGGTGVALTLTGSVAGVRYQLFNSGVPVSTMMGTGAALNFGLQTASGSYSAIATNTVTSCAVNMSGTQTVSIDPLPTVFTVGGGGSYCAGGAGLHLTLSGSQAGVSYQLYSAGAAVGFPVAGTGTGSLDLGAQTAAGIYSVIATSASGCTAAMSGTTTISVNPVLVPTASISTGMGDSVCSGVTSTFSAVTTNAGSAPVYQWKVNGANTGISSSTLSYIPTNGDVVSVTVTSNATCAAPATVTVSNVISVLPQGLPAVNIASDQGNAVCENTMVTFSAAPTLGGTAPSYLWVKNGTPVGTSSTYSYIPDNGDVILCMMVSNYPCRFADTVYSNSVTMRVDAPVVPSLTISADPGLGISEGTSLTLTANVTNTGTAAPRFQWYVGSTLITGATFSTLTSTSFRDGDSVTCVVTNGGACALSAFNSVTIVVFPLGVTPVTHASSDVKLVPNPNKGEFTVKGTLGTSTDEEVSLEITNMLGQVVYRNKVMARNGNIDVHVQLSSTLANGMYMLNMRTENENKVFHIVVEQ